MPKPFHEKLCAKCGKSAEVLYINPLNTFLCWDCFGYKKAEKDESYWEGRAEHYRKESKYMALSVKMAWAQLTIANQRLENAGLKKVFNEMEKA